MSTHRGLTIPERDFALSSELHEQALVRLSRAAQNRLRAGLLEIDARRYQDTDPRAWRRYLWDAYDVLATEVLSEHPATDELLEDILPVLVSDAVIDHHWVLCISGSATCSEGYSERVGRYWLVKGCHAMVKRILAGSISKWKANWLRRHPGEGATSGVRATRCTSVPFDTPAGALWKDVTIRFLDGHTVAVEVQDRIGRYNFSQMGMVNGKDGNPTIQWRLLLTFAKAKGILDWKHGDADLKNKKRRQILAKNLQAFFSLSGDPFRQINGGGGWAANFTILPER